MDLLKRHSGIVWGGRWEGGVYDDWDVYFGLLQARALVFIDDWDVYYERGRKPKESLLKYEATRSEGDYRRKVLLARVICYRGERTWCERLRAKRRGRERCW